MSDLLWLAALALAAIGGLAALSQRSLFYPPATFCLVWAGALTGLILSGDLFVPLSERTIAIYVAGAVAFTAGAAVAHPLAGSERPASPRAPALPSWVLYGMLTVLVVGLPFYVLRVRAMVEEAGVAGFFFSLRVQSLRAAADPSATNIGIIGNLVPLSAICVLVAYRETFAGRAEKVAASLIFLLALVYAVLTGGRGSGMSLALSVIALAALRRGPVPKATLAIAVFGFVAVFVSLAVLVRKGSADPNASWADNARAVTENFQVYALGGTVAFNRIADDPGSIPSTGGVLRTAKEIANGFGARYEIPSLHAQFTSIGDGLQTNVYTLYMPYYQDVGAVGTVALIFLLGILTTFAYLRARRGGPDAMVFSAVFFAGLMQSIFNEPFYTNINYLGKLTACLLLLDVLLALRVAAPRSTRGAQPMRVEV